MQYKKLEENKIKDNKIDRMALEITLKEETKEII